MNYAARRSLALERKEHKQQGEATTLTLGGAHAVLMPVLSSASLLLIFYFFSVVQQLVCSLCSALQPVLIQLQAWRARCAPSSMIEVALGWRAAVRCS